MTRSAPRTSYRPNAESLESRDLPSAGLLTPHAHDQSSIVRLGHYTHGPTNVGNGHGAYLIALRFDGSLNYQSAFKAWTAGVKYAEAHHVSLAIPFRVDAFTLRTGPHTHLLLGWHDPRQNEGAFIAADVTARGAIRYFSGYPNPGEFNKAHKGDVNVDQTDPSGAKLHIDFQLHAASNRRLVGSISLVFAMDTPSTSPDPCFVDPTCSDF